MEDERRREERGEEHLLYFQSGSETAFENRLTISGSVFQLGPDWEGCVYTDTLPSVLEEVLMKGEQI